MKMNVKTLTDQDIENMKRRRLEAMQLQKIEGNPLNDDDIAMFEMFEREQWTSDQRRAYILKWAKDITATS